jgi:hypothetical protein
MTPGSGGAGLAGSAFSFLHPASHPTTSGPGVPCGEVQEAVTTTSVLTAGAPNPAPFFNNLQDGILDDPLMKRQAGGGGGGCCGGGPPAACLVPPCSAAPCDPIPHPAQAQHLLNNGGGSGGFPAHNPAVDLFPEAVTTTPGQVLPPPPRAREPGWDPAGGGSAVTTPAQESPIAFTDCVPPTAPTHHRGPYLMVAVTTTPEMGEPSPKPLPAPPRKTPVLMVAVTTTPETGHLPQPQPLLPTAASSSLQPVSRGGEPRLPPQCELGEKHTFFPASGQGEMLCNFAQDAPFPGTSPPGKGPAEASNEAFRGQSGPVAPGLDLRPLMNTLSEGRDSRKFSPAPPRNSARRRLLPLPTPRGPRQPGLIQQTVLPLPICLAVMLLWLPP